MVKGESYFQAMSSSVRLGLSQTSMKSTFIDRIRSTIDHHLIGFKLPLYLGCLSESSPFLCQFLVLLLYVHLSHDSVTLRLHQISWLRTYQVLAPTNEFRHVKTDSSSSTFYSCNEHTTSKSPTPASIGVVRPPTPTGPRIPRGTPTGPKALRTGSVRCSPSFSSRKLLQIHTGSSHSIRNRHIEIAECKDTPAKNVVYHPADGFRSLLNRPVQNNSTNSTKKRKEPDEGKPGPSLSPTLERRSKFRKKDEAMFGKGYIKPERLYNDHYSPPGSRQASPAWKDGGGRRGERKDRDAKERLMWKERQGKKYKVQKNMLEPRRKLSLLLTPALPIPISPLNHQPSSKPHLAPAQLTSSSRNTFLPLLSIGMGSGAAGRREEVCYNCGGKGHWFMDCVVGCGRCGGDGHRTLDCIVLYRPIGGGVKRE